MSCNCETTLSPSGEPLPSIADVQGLSAVPTPCCEPSCETSSSSEGTDLASSWLDSVCASEGVTILGRVGSKLARFAGSGFLALKNGKFSVVRSVPLRVGTLWHRWWQPTATTRPILGEPMDFPYLAVTDEAGNLHGIKGKVSSDTVPYWDSTEKTFSQKPVSEIPKRFKGVIPRADGIELTGFTPIADGGDVDSVRPMKALSGKGLVILEEQVTVDDSCECAPGSGTASAATTLAFPTPIADETYTLKYSTALGLHWSEDA